MANPSYSDDVTINLDSTTPYVDIPVTITEPVDATVQTFTGTPQNNPSFIDSWIEIWQGAIRLATNDDGAHSATNVLASIITIPLTAGEYFIRATSFAFIASNGTQFPNGSYVLTTNLIIATPTPTPSPTVTEPTLEPSPSPTETLTPTPTPSPTETTVEPSPTPTQTSFSPTPEPTPEPSSPSPSPSDTPQPSESPTVPVVPTQEPNVPDLEPSPEFLLPSELPTPDVPDTLEEVVDLSFNDLPSISDPDVSFQPFPETDEGESILEFLPEFSLEGLQETFQQISETITAAFESVPGGEQVLAAAEFVGEQFTAAAEFATNLGTDFTPEEREQAQQVVLGAVIVTQLASTRRIK